MAPTEEDNTNYTVFIRLPFPRGDFVDPPLVKWNSSKDIELWKVLSSNPKGGEFDWHGLAERFDVALPFLLQQAAWLYARQLSQVREQLRRAKPSTSNSPTPPLASGTNTTATLGGLSMRRGGSAGGSGSRGPSSLSVRPRVSSELRNEPSTPSTPVQGRIPYSRTTSANTITQLPKGSVIQHAPSSPKQPRRSIDSERTEYRSTHSPAYKRSPQPTNLDSPSSSSSSDSAPMVHSRAFPRRHRFSASKPAKKPLQALSSADEDDSDDSPAFLPFSAQAQSTGKQPTGEPSRRNQPPPPQKGKGKAPVRPSATPTAPTATSTSASSASQHSSAPSASASASPLQPAHANANANVLSSPTGATLAALSPRQRRLAQAGSESAGTPSMGSSFSDLDDASLTKSALEEALAREIRSGKGSLGVVGRMGGLWKQGGGGMGQGGKGGASSRAV